MQRDAGRPWFWVPLCLMLALRPQPTYAATAIVVDPAAAGPILSSKILGMNMANWFDQTRPGIADALKAAGIRSARWPGGSASDRFHWQSNTACKGAYIHSNASFDDFMTHVAQPAGLDVAVTVNYGSNVTCTAGGDPAEAAAWVAYARTHGDRISRWTVGNEVYGDWEYDLHSKPHDAATYARAVATGFYPAMKAADPNAQIGIVVAPDARPAWDPTVLEHARYDFVELHWYAQAPGKEDDRYLLTRAPQALVAQLAALHDELRRAGHANTPIYLGELGSVAFNPGKQTTSITQALFAGEILGELMDAGLERATWWLGFGGCSDATTGNFSSRLYGLQDFAGYMVFSDGTPEYGCPSAQPVPFGTLLPTARAFQLFALVAHDGEHVIGVTLHGDSELLRAYAATHDSGMAVVLFNLDPMRAMPVSLAVKGRRTAASVAINTYDKAIYDELARGVWAEPTEATLGPTTLPMAMTLPPWSISVVRLSP